MSEPHLLPPWNVLKVTPHMRREAYGINVVAGQKILISHLGNFVSNYDFFPFQISATFFTYTQLHTPEFFIGFIFHASLWPPRSTAQDYEPRKKNLQGF